MKRIEKIDKVITVIGVVIILLTLSSLLFARSYSNRAIETTDQIVVTGADGQEYLNKWSQVETFAEDNIDTISGDLVLSDSLYVTGNAVFAGEISDSTYFADNVTIEGDLDVNGSSVIADSVYVGGNLRVDGVIYGLDAYCIANVTTAGDTMITDTVSTYRNISVPFTNRFVYNFAVTDSGIVYTGEQTRLFEVTAEISYSTNKNTNTITHAFALNDTVCACSEYPWKTQTAGYYGNGSPFSAFELETGDRVTLIVKSDSADTSIYYHKYVTSIRVIR